MLGHVRALEVRESVKDVFEAWVKNKESESSDMVKVDMQQWFKNLMLNVIVRIVSGKRFSLMDEEGIRFQNVARRFFELFGAFVVSVFFFPYLKCFDLGGYKKDMKITTKEIDNIFEGLLQANKREKESKQQHESNQVFVDVLISVLEGAYEEDFPGFDHSTIINASCLVNFNFMIYITSTLSSFGH